LHSLKCEIPSPRIARGCSLLQWKLYDLEHIPTKFVHYIKARNGQDEARKGGKKGRNGKCMKHADTLLSFFLSFLYLLIYPTDITN
jgi:hypothetical protein